MSNQKGDCKMNEKIIAKGYLADAKKRYREKDLEASALIVSIRMLLNPYEEDLIKIDTEKLIVMSKRLHECIEELKSLKARIQKLETELNG